MPNNTPITRHAKPLFHKAALALLLAAAALTMVTLPESRLLAACDESHGGGCAQVIGGHWSYWLAVLPVQWAGLAMYLTLAAFAWRFSPSSSKKHWAVRTLCGAIIGAVAWFSFVQACVLKQFCPLCVTIHLCAGLAAAFLLSATRSSGSLPTFGLRPVFVGTIVTLCLLAAGSPWVIEPQEATRSVALNPSSKLLVEKQPGGDLSLLAGTSHLAAASLPRLGAADAKHTAVMLMNHDCPHCIRQLKALTEVMQNLAAKDLAIYFVPVGTNATNAEAQATLLALWAGAPAVHDEIVEDLAAKRIALTAEAIRKAAADHTTAEEAAGWLTESALKQARDQLVRHGQPIKAASETRGFRGLPQLWFPSSAELGSAEDPAFYYEALARHLGIHRSTEPRMVIESQAITLGRTPVAGHTRVTLKVSNEGSGELALSGIKLPAGWKSVSVFPKRLAPALSDVLEVEIASPAVEGPWSAEFHVLSNSATSVPPVVFKGEAVASLPADAGRIVLSDIAEGEKLTSEERIIQPQPDFVFGNASFEMPGFKAAQTALSPARYRFEQVDALPVGGYLGTLRLPVRWTGSAVSWTLPTLEVQVSAHVRAAVIVTPQRVVLSPLPQRTAADLHHRHAPARWHHAIASCRGAACPSSPSWRDSHAEPSRRAPGHRDHASSSRRIQSRSAHRQPGAAAQRTRQRQRFHAAGRVRRSPPTSRLRAASAALIYPLFQPNSPSPMNTNTLNHRGLPLMRLLAALCAIACFLGLVQPIFAAPAVVEEYFIPFDEDDILSASQRAYTDGAPANCNAGTTRDPLSPIRSFTSFVVGEDSTVIVFDHWEDGYEAIANVKTQSSTEIWGDGNTTNGTAPGHPTDLLDRGDVVTINNNVVTTTRQSVVDYDGGDRLVTSGALSMTRSGWATQSETLMAGATEVYPTAAWGTSFKLPVGENFVMSGNSSGDNRFEYTAATIQASQDSTQINIDADANGSAETTVTINRGESYFVNGGLQLNATITSNKVISVVLYTADKCATFEADWYYLPHLDQYSDSYLGPVGTPTTGQTQIHVHNPNNTSITVNWFTQGPAAQTALTIPANSAVSVISPNLSGQRFVSSGGQTFIATASISADSASSSTWDWGYTLIPSSLVSNQIISTAWAPGRDPNSSVSPTANVSPVWVTVDHPNNPTSTATVQVCVDFNNNGGSLTDSNGVPLR